MNCPFHQIESVSSSMLINCDVLSIVKDLKVLFLNLPVIYLLSAGGNKSSYISQVIGIGV